VRAALLNPRRRAWRLLATREAARRLDAALLAALRERGLRAEEVERRELEARLPAGAVHQGLALESSPLDQPDLDTLIAELGPAPADGRQVIVALDQVTDPQNAGAVLRSAAAFGAAAVIHPRHGRAPESGALAKAASGALDVVPYIDAGNLARALDALKAEGFWVLGLAAGEAAPLAEAAPGARVVLVLGAEGTGLRRLVREACDLLVRLPTRPPIDQLNVSNAAAVALYELLGRGPG
jgi:23S rRNA (guanosine2251-2'-O)-methyltransferase